MATRQTMAASQSAPDATPAKQAIETIEARQLRYMEDNLDGDRSYLDGLMSFYMANLIAGTKMETRTAFMICRGIEEVVDIKEVDNKPVKFPIKKQKSPSKKENYYKRDEQNKKKVEPEDWATLQEFFKKDAKNADITAHDITYRNLNRLFDLLNLDEDEKGALKLLYTAKKNAAFSTLISNIFGEDLKQASVGFARMMGASGNAAKVFNALHFSGRLSTYGLVGVDGPMDPNSMSDVMEMPSIDEDLLSSLDKPDMSDEEIVSIILGKQRKSDLTLTDFEHVGEPLEHMAKVIKNAVESGKKGINILLYGPAGSGKTELSAAIATALGLKIYAVGEDEDNAVFSVSMSSDSTGKKRIAQLGRSHALLKGSKDSIVLFDEIEDLLIKGGDSKKSADSESKIGINRLLEENPVVTIWTGNEPDKLIEAVRQRMTYSIYMDYPPTLVREKIWRRRLEIDKCTLPDENIRDLSRRYAPPPRLISKAVEVLSLAGGGMETIEETLRASSKLSSGQTDGILIEDPVMAGFDLKYLNADCNLRETFSRLTELAKAKKPFSLLVQDKPGLGADDFLRLMAEEMSMNPQEYDVSALITPHPMMPPEAKIKMAFAGAVDGRQFLILKGLENMVSNPESSATKEWDDPVVKLLIKEALMHRLPLAVTMKESAKLPDHLDIIFSDRIKMRPISQEQGARLYESMTGEKMPEDLAGSLEGAAPEDLLMLKDIFAKSANDTIDHGRAASILGRLRKARGNISSGGPGFLNS